MTSRLERARDAYANSRWAEAYELFKAMRGAEGLGGDDLAASAESTATCCTSRRQRPSGREALGLRSRRPLHAG